MRSRGNYSSLRVTSLSRNLYHPFLILLNANNIIFCTYISMFSSQHVCLFSKINDLLQSIVDTPIISSCLFLALVFVIHNNQSRSSNMHYSTQFPLLESILWAKPFWPIDCRWVAKLFNVGSPLTTSTSSSFLSHAATNSSAISVSDILSIFEWDIPRAPPRAFKSLAGISLRNLDILKWCCRAESGNVGSQRKKRERKRNKKLWY